MTTRLGLIAAIAFVSIVSPFMAASAADALPSSGQSASLEQIRTQQQAIRTEINTVSGRFETMPRVKRDLILSQQDIFFALTAGIDDVQQLAPDKRVQAFNALEKINAAITNKADERLVCTRTKPIGSNRTERVCRSVAQIEAEKTNARDYISKGQAMQTWRGDQH